MIYRFFIIIFLLSAWQIVNAKQIAGQAVKVHLIVFTHVSKQTMASETWTKQLIVPYIKNTIQLEENVTSAPTENQYGVHLFTTGQYRLLPPGKIDMPATINRLKRHNDKVILAVAWTQPAVETNRWIHVYGGQAYSATGQPINMPDNSVYTMQPIDNAVFWQFNGLLRIDYDGFFNIKTKFYLTLPAELGDVNAQQYGLIPLMSVPLNDFRRIKLNQMAYFDHPLYGVIVFITPYQQ